MKLKKVVLSIIIVSIILTLMPTKVFAITQSYEYNVVNIIISFLLLIIGIILTISYIISAIIYAIKSKEEKKKKIKEIIKWLIVTLFVDIALIIGAVVVFRLGMTPDDSEIGYGRHYNILTLCLSYIMRIVALLSIITYIIWAIRYFVKSGEDKEQKIRKIIKWLIIIAVVVGLLLCIAKPIYEMGITYVKTEINFPDINDILNRR